MASRPVVRLAPRWAIATLIILGLALVVVGVVYFSEPARYLPSFFPGHAARSSRHHAKHGLLAIVLGIAAFAGAWIGSGRKRHRWDEWATVPAAACPVARQSMCRLAACQFCNHWGERHRRIGADYEIGQAEFFTPSENLVGRCRWVVG